MNWARPSYVDCAMVIREDRFQTIANSPRFYGMFIVNGILPYPSKAMQA